MKVFTNYNKLIDYRLFDKKVIIIKTEQDLSRVFNSIFHPFIIVTEDFPAFDNLTVCYSKRKYPYEIAVIGDFSKDRIIHFLNNDVLSVFREPLFEADVNKNFQRYLLRNKLFTKHRRNNGLLKINTNRYISVDDIKFIRAYGNYTLIFTISNRIIERKAFSDFIKILPDNIFIQTHRSFAVNIRYISEIKSFSVKILNDTIPISSRKRKEVILRIEKMMNNKNTFIT